MSITKQRLEHELEGLRLQLQQAQAQVEAVLGAIQATEQYIKFADEPDDKEEKHEKQDT